MNRAGKFRRRGQFCFGGDTIRNFEGLISFYGAYDLNKTHAFYHDVLQLPMFKDQGVCKIYAVPGGGSLGFCSHMAVTAAEKSPIITILAQNVDEVYSDITSAGLVADAPVKNERFRIYHFFVKDPNGYAVEIQRFID